MDMELMREIIRVFNNKYANGEPDFNLEDGAALTLIHSTHSYHKDNYLVYAVQSDNETFLVRVSEINGQLHVEECHSVKWNRVSNS